MALPPSVSAKSRTRAMVTSKARATRTRATPLIVWLFCNLAINSPYPGSRALNILGNEGYEAVTISAMRPRAHRPTLGSQVWGCEDLVPVSGGRPRPGPHGAILRLLLVAAAIAATLVVAGCGAPDPDRPEPQPTHVAPTPSPHPTATATAAPGQALAVVMSVVVADRQPGLPQYDRDEWRHWTDVDGDCQDTRQEVLIAESLVPVTFTDEEACRVAAGRWTGPYTGDVLEDPRKLDVDHMVPLANAHLSGGHRWSAERKELYANSLSYPGHLVAATAAANRSKGAKGTGRVEAARPDLLVPVRHGLGVNQERVGPYRDQGGGGRAAGNAGRLPAQSAPAGPHHRHAHPCERPSSASARPRRPHGHARVLTEPARSTTLPGRTATARTSTGGPKRRPSTRPRADRIPTPTGLTATGTALRAGPCPALPNRRSSR